LRKKSSKGKLAFTCMNVTLLQLLLLLHRLNIAIRNLVGILTSENMTYIQIGSM